MKKSLFCIATALMLTGCAEFLPSDGVLEVAPQSFQEYLLRQEDELQEGSSSELPDNEYDADNSSAESAVSPDTGTDTNSDSAGIRQIAAQIFTGCLRRLCPGIFRTLRAGRSHGTDDLRHC